MLHNFIATIGAPRRALSSATSSNEELTAYYELADVFVCASEHEGFCVPLVESFHMGVPVLAYAATAVPSTMDGAGVLYTTRIRCTSPALINAVVDDATSRERDRRGAGRRARSARGEGLRAARCCASSTRCSRRRGATHPPVAFDFWDQVDAGRGARRDQGRTARRPFRRCRRRRRPVRPPSLGESRTGDHGDSR